MGFVAEIVSGMVLFISRKELAFDAAGYIDSQYSNVYTILPRSIR